MTMVACLSQGAGARGLTVARCVGRTLAFERAVSGRH
jgi:hypothetical protein